MRGIGLILILLLSVMTVSAWFGQVAIYEPPNFEFNNQTNVTFGLTNTSVNGLYSPSVATNYSSQFTNVMNCSGSDGVVSWLKNTSTGTVLGTDSSGNYSLDFWLYFEPTTRDDAYVVEFRNTVDGFRKSIVTTNGNCLDIGNNVIPCFANSRWYHVGYAVRLSEPDNCSIFVDGAFRNSTTEGGSGNCGGAGFEQGGANEINICNIVRATDIAQQANVLLARIVLMNNFFLNESEHLLLNYSGAAPPPFVANNSANITLYNLTSDGGDLTEIFTTKDTTPQWRLTTDRNANVSVSSDNSTFIVCSTTGTTEHTCTQSNAYGIGVAVQHFRTNNSGGNTSWFSKRINVLDNVIPTVIPQSPANASSITYSTDNTSFIYFVTGTNVACNLKINNNVAGSTAFTTRATNTSSVTNNSNNTISYGQIEVGTFLWAVNCSDNQTSDYLAPNGNQSQNFSLTIAVATSTVNLFLDGLAISRDYEFGDNITVNLSSSCGPTGNMTVRNLGYNEFTTSAYWAYNITRMFIGSFINGSGNDVNLTSLTLDTSQQIRVVFDNRTTLENVSFNITGTSTPANLSITSGNTTEKNNSDWIFPDGVLAGTQYIINSFKHNGVKYNAVNITYSSGSAKTISLNITNINMITTDYLLRSNLTFQLSGFNTDPIASVNSTFVYLGSTANSSPVNTSFYQLNVTQEAIIEDFEDNSTFSSDWTLTGSYRNAKYVKDNTDGNNCGGIASDHPNDDCFDFDSIISSGNSEAVYNKIDLRNLTYLKFSYLLSGSADDTGITSGPFYARVVITDGTNRVTLVNSQNTCHPFESRSFGSGVGNMTLSRINLSENSWIGNSTASGASTSIGTSSLDPNLPWKLEAQMHASCSGSQAASIDINIGTIRGGFGLRREVDSRVLNSSNGLLTSNVLINPTETITAVTLTADCTQYPNTNITFQVSNNNGTNWKDAILGARTVFDTTGRNLTWRLNFTGNGSATPICRRITAEVQPGAISNVSVDVGSDGTKEFLFNSTLNSTTSPQIVNLSTDTIRAYSFTNCNGSKTCNIPISIISQTPGNLQINRLNYSHMVNPIPLNVSRMETCSNCTINISFSGGTVQVNSFAAHFKGRLNLTFNGTSVGTSNCTASAVTQTARLHYSSINITTAYDYLEFFVTNFVRKGSYINASNVTPFGQTSLSTNLSQRITANLYFNQSYSSNNPNPGYNGTNTTIFNLSIFDLFTITKGVPVIWKNFTWVDSSRNSTSCNESFIIYHSTDNSTWTALSRSLVPFNFTDRTERYLRPELTLITNFSESNCSLSNISFHYNYTPANPSTSFYNLTALGYDWGINITQKINQSTPGCMNFTFSTTHYRNDSKNISEIPTLIQGYLNLTNKTRVWYFVDYLNCNTTALGRYVIREPEFITCCVNCTGGCT